MATTQIMTRILNKIDSYSNWVKESAVVLKKGEIGIATIETADSAAGLTPPCTGLKVGNGSDAFKDLPWIQAIAGDVSTFVKGANFKDEAAFKAYVSTLTSTDVGNLQSAIDALEGRMDTAEGKITTLETTTAGHTTSISSLTTRMGTAETNIGKKADATQVATDIAAAKTELLGVNAEAGSTIKGAYDKAAAAQNAADAAQGNATSALNKIGSTAYTGDSLTAAVAALQASVGDSTAGLGTQVATLRSEMDDIKPRVEAAEGEIDTLQSITSGYTGAGSIKTAVEAAAALAQNGVDAAGAEKTRAEAAEAALSTRIEKAETFLAAAEIGGDGVIDTLKEIQDYIESDTTGAAAMTASINKNATDIATNTKAISDEATRATAAEGTLQSNIDTVSAKANKNAEDIATANAAITKEVSDRTTAVSTAKSEAIAAAKTETTSQVSAAKTALIGSTSDAVTADTINGAKAKADAVQQNLDNYSATVNKTAITNGDGLVQSLSVGGTATRRKVKMTDMDDTSVFVFYCGTASDVI